MADTAVQKYKDGTIDEVQLFMLYCLFGGNTRRVAVVSRVDEADVKSLAHDFNWATKAAGRARLDTEEGANTERLLNRVSSYVMAERLSRVFGNLIAALDGDPSFARAFCTALDKDGNPEFSTKNLVELSKGLQITHDMKYRALGDKQAQEADTSSGTKSAAEQSLLIYKALANRFDRAIVVDTSTEILKAVNDTAARKDPDDSSGAAN